MEEQNHIEGEQSHRGGTYHRGDHIEEEQNLKEKGQITMRTDHKEEKITERRYRSCRGRTVLECIP